MMLQVSLHPSMSVKYYVLPIGSLLWNHNTTYRVTLASIKFGERTLAIWMFSVLDVHALSLSWQVFKLVIFTQVANSPNQNYAKFPTIRYYSYYHVYVK